MAISRRTWGIVVQFTLIIVICATISGIVGGVTSKVSKWTNSAAAVQPGVNSTMTVIPQSVRRVGRMFVA
jgi:hypothetical protein